MRTGDRHTPEAKARMSRSMTALADLRADELGTLRSIGVATVEAYAAAAGCAPNTARARLNRLVDEGMARRFRVQDGRRGGAFRFEAVEA